MKKSDLKNAIEKADTFDVVNKMIRHLRDAATRNRPISYTVAEERGVEPTRWEEIENITGVDQLAIRGGVYEVLIAELERLREDIVEELSTMGVEL